MKAIYLLFFLGFLSVTSSAQTLEWAKDMDDVPISGEPNHDNNIMLKDAEGNTYTCGRFFGEVDFDPGPEEYLMNAEGGNLNMAGFILKLDTDENFVWAKMVGSSEYTNINSINMNSLGDLILSGAFSDDVDFDPGVSEHIVSSPDGNGVFILNLSDDGEFNWVKSILGMGSSQSSHLDLDETDNIYLASSTYNSVDVDPSENEYFIESDGTQNPFIVKLDANGQFVWARTFGGTGGDVIKTINVTENELIITGTFQEIANLNPSGTPFEVTAIENDAFVSTFTLGGVFETAFTLSGEGHESISQISRDSDGNMLMIGTFSYEVVFNNDETLSTMNGVIADKDAFFAKYSANGDLIWAKSIGGEGYDSGNCIAVDGIGNVYLSGLYDGSIDVDPGIAELTFFTAENGTGSYFIKLSGSGDLIWAHNFSSSSTLSNEVFIKDFLLNDLDEIQIVGSYHATTDFDLAPYAQVFLEGSLIEGSDFGYGSFMAKYSQGPCDDLSLSFDSLSHVSCTGAGYIDAVAHNGVEPYQYEWNTTPPVSGVVIEPASGGVYELSVTDADGCSRIAMAHVNPPSSVIQQDLQVNFVSSEFRTGFPASAWLDGFNDGCVPVSGTISMVKDPLVEFDSATISPDDIIGDSLVWYFENYEYDSGHFQSLVNFTTSLEAQIGDTVCFDVYINPQDGDANPENNHRHYCFPVVNGYDPNDKQVYPQGECEEHYTLKDEVLTYTVRFQNTGNSEAINVHLIDSLSPYFDLNSLNVVAKSHEMFTEVLPGNVLNFKFDNILLPDSASGAELSQGYVIFEISPLADLPDGTVIENKSEIFFDFNPAVVTNTTFNTMVDEIPFCNLVDGIEEPYSKIRLAIYPNPAADKISISCAFRMDQISIYNVTGTLVENYHSQGFQREIDVSKFSQGVYLIQAQTSGGIALDKLVVH